MHRIRQSLLTCPDPPLPQSRSLLSRSSPARGTTHSPPPPTASCDAPALPPPAGGSLPTALRRRALPCLSSSAAATAGGAQVALRPQGGAEADRRLHGRAAAHGTRARAKRRGGREGRSTSLPLMLPPMRRVGRVACREKRGSVDSASDGRAPKRTATWWRCAARRRPASSTRTLCRCLVRARSRPRCAS